VAKLLVVDDDVDLSEIVSDALKAEGHAVEVSNTGEDALTRLRLSGYDTIILDVDIGDASGFDICRKLRHAGNAVPVIIMTGKTHRQDKLQGFDCGADDYVTKPVDVVELCARVRALLRRSSQAVSNLLQVGELTLDPVSYRVTRKGEEIRLLPKEFQVLEFLMRHPGQVFSHEALLQRVWPSESDATDEAIRSCMKRLRKKIDGDSQIPLVENVPRVGYRLRI
jgi:DNA-binding response OmpR family regulator